MLCMLTQAECVCQAPWRVHLLSTRVWGVDLTDSSTPALALGFTRPSAYTRGPLLKFGPRLSSHVTPVLYRSAPN